MVRQTFREAAYFFVQVVEQVTDDGWDAPGLGVWTVRELVGHTTRALTTVETYAARPADRVELDSPADYLAAALASYGQAEVVAQRGRQAGLELSDNPRAVVKEIVDRVLNKVDQLPDSIILSVPVGGMRLIDYLPTRVMELTIHSLDLAEAIGAPASPPPAPLAVTLHLLADLALQTGQGPVLSLAMTGRGPLPRGFNLLEPGATP